MISELALLLEVDAGSVEVLVPAGVAVAIATTIGIYLAKRKRD